MVGDVLGSGCFVAVVVSWLSGAVCVGSSRWGRCAAFSRCFVSRGGMAFIWFKQ